MNRIDQLIDRLNAIEGLAFTRDAWENKAPDDYGTVELTGQSEAVWADDAMAEQAFTLRVTLYVRDGGEQWLGLVQQAMADCDLVYGLPERGFLYDINKVEWRWTARLYGALEVDDGGTTDD